MKSHHENIISPDLDTLAPSIPGTRLFICTTPRTAGHTLCHAMRQLGWGVPTEYFFPTIAVPLYRRWISPDCSSMDEVVANIRQYGATLLSKRSAGGIFATKLFPQDLQAALAAVGERTVKTRYIHLKRQDKVGQTISLAAALLTGKPFESDEVIESMPRVEKIDEYELQNLYQTICRMEDFWEQCSPLVPPENAIEITTEALVSDPVRTMQSIAEKFSLPFDARHAKNLEALATRPYATENALKRDLLARYGDFVRRLTESGA